MGVIRKNDALGTGVGGGNMRRKKLRIVLLGLLCLFLTSCSNEYARLEYENEEKIAQDADHYSKERSVSRSMEGEFTLTVSKFDGRETLWKETWKEDKEIEIGISLHISKGQVKIVHIDPEDNVATLLECTPETAADEFRTEKLIFKSGQNRLKIVGYDCEDVELKILFNEPE